MPFVEEVYPQIAQICTDYMVGINLNISRLCSNIGICANLWINFILLSKQDRAFCPQI